MGFEDRDVRNGTVEYKAGGDDLAIPLQVNASDLRDLAAFSVFGSLVLSCSLACSFAEGGRNRHESCQQEERAGDHAHKQCCEQHLPDKSLPPCGLSQQPSWRFIGCATRRRKQHENIDTEDQNRSSQPVQVAQHSNQNGDESVDHPVVPVDQDPVCRFRKQACVDTPVLEIMAMPDITNEVQGDCARCNESSEQAERRRPIQGE